MDTSFALWLPYLWKRAPVNVVIRLFYLRGQMTDIPVLQSLGSEFECLSKDQLSQWHFILALLCHSTKS